MNTIFTTATIEKMFMLKWFQLMEKICIKKMEKICIKKMGVYNSPVLETNETASMFFSLKTFFT